MSAGANGRGRTLVIVAIPLAVIALPFLAAVLGLDGGGGGEESFLELPDDPRAMCVRPADYMRFHHWQLLREVRDDVVRTGHRPDISLAGCRGCHENRERFCNRCHAAVSLEPDCFGCHYYPARPPPATTAADAAGGGR